MNAGSTRRGGLLVALGLVFLGGGIAAAAPAQPYTALTAQFDHFNGQTANLPMKQRVALFRRKFNSLFPGYYEPRGRKNYDKSVSEALSNFPELALAYREVEREFPIALNSAVERFRVYFPGFTSPLPVWFVHSLGESDGGTREINKRDTAVFGADMIAKYDRDRMQPFLEHELLHLENARYFSDCDPLWCTLWKEGLAVYAVSKMTPGATDHQLLLTDPKPIRSQVDQHWGEALCLTKAKLDSRDPGDIEQFFFLSGKSPDLPTRFGYYVGYRIVQNAGEKYSLPALTRLDHIAALALLKETLSQMVVEAHMSCGHNH